MKVVQINAVCGTGSTGRICTDLADALIAGGHECKILYGNGRSTYPHGVNISNKWLVKLNALRARITGNDMGGCFISTWRIIRFLKKYKPDVVHLHNVHAHFVNLPILCRYLAKNDIPTVITLHDCWFFTGGCTHYTVAQCNRWQKDCANCPGYSNGISCWFFNTAKRSLNKKRNALLSIPRLHVIGCSKWITNEAARSFLKATTLYTIHNGIDTTKFRPIRSTFKEKIANVNDRIIIGFANKWLTQKNKVILSSIIENLHTDEKFIILGCSSNDMKHLPSDIIGIPYTNSIDELVEIYTTADLFLNPSEEDTLPTVNLETQACGVPIIALKRTGIPETVNLKAGKIIEENRSNTWVTSIQEILNKQNNTQKASLITPNFEHGAFIKHYTDLYLTIK